MASAVALAFGALRRTGTVPDSPLVRLQLLKQAIGEVSLTTQEEIIQGKLDSAEEKFGWTMRFLRAGGAANPGRMERCAAAHPHLKEFD